MEINQIMSKNVFEYYQYIFFKLYTFGEKKGAQDSVRAAIGLMTGSLCLYVFLIYLFSHIIMGISARFVSHQGISIFVAILILGALHYYAMGRKKNWIKL
jgi:hypothetical protein